MACAFYLGFFSGQRVGYENALVGSASTLARFALNTKELNSGDGLADESMDGPSAPSKEREEGKRGARAQREQSALSLLNEVSAAPKVEKVEQEASAVVNDGGAVESASAKVNESAKVVAAESVQAKAEDEVIRVYGNERPTKRTSISELKNSVATQAKAAKPVEVIAPEVKTVKIQPPAQKPQVLASLQPEAKSLKAQPQQNRKVESVPVKSILAAGWYAQIAAPRKMADAESLANRLRRNGFPVSIESASVKGEAYYRVIVGPEDNRKQAQVLVEQLRSERSVQGEPFIRNIR
jgi:cell division septation protein DedD